MRASALDDGDDMTEGASTNLEEPGLVDLAAVRLIDVRACAAMGSVSRSWWNEKVRLGRAPAPAFRGPRMTRWRARDVAAFWANFGDVAAV
jgi:predicted DNA-binding transcriptional regulator AlpA